MRDNDKRKRAAGGEEGGKNNFRIFEPIQWWRHNRAKGQLLRRNEFRHILIIAVGTRVAKEDSKVSEEIRNSEISKREKIWV